MKKAAVVETKNEDLPVEALILQCKADKYKLAFSAIRWAKDIKQKESLPDPVQALVPRALREILLGKVSLEEIEKLPLVVKMAPTAPVPPPAPTITLNVQPDEKEEVAEAEA